MASEGTDFIIHNKFVPSFSITVDRKERIKEKLVKVVMR